MSSTTEHPGQWQADDFVSYPDNARPGKGSSIYG